MSLSRKDLLRRANERHRIAAQRLAEANTALDAAEREFRLAGEAVESLEQLQDRDGAESSN